MALVYAIWCPRGEVCKKGGRMLAKADSEEGVRERLRCHLHGSPSHDLSAEEIEQIVAETEVVTWLAGADDEQPAKKGRWSGSAAPIGNTSQRWTPPPQHQQQQAASQSDEYDLDRREHAIIADAVAEGVRRAVTSAGSSGDGAILATRPTLATGGGTVTMSMSTLRSVIDTLGRAEHATRHAARLSQAAANAFEAEALNIASAKATIEAIGMRF